MRPIRVEVRILADFTMEAIAIFTCLLCTGIFFRKFSLHASFLLSFIKCFFVYSYFASFPNPLWNLKDDITYLAAAEYLLNQNLNPFGLLFSEYGRQQLFSISGGHHVIYQWINFFSAYYVSDSYFVPVFINVVLTTLATVFFMGIVEDGGISKTMTLQLGALSAIGFELLSWNSFLNIKEPVVIFLSILGIHFLIQLQKKRSIGALVGILIVFWAFYYVRFYIPALLALAFLAALWPNSKSPLYFFVVSTFVAFSLQTIGIEKVSRFVTTDFIYNAIRFVASPRPWGIEESYSFLLVASIFHFLFLPFAILGVKSVCERGFWGRFFVMYMTVSVVFYATLPDFNGPRHRHQLYFIFTLIQYFGFIRVLAIYRSSSERRVQTKVFV